MKWELAVPSTGPIPLRHGFVNGIISGLNGLQYPLPGLSHCDLYILYLQRPLMMSCSTLYRAYPIATYGSSSLCSHSYPACSTLYRAYPIATTIVAEKL